jgi:hypothetical protein
MKLLITQSSPTSHFFIPFGPSTLFSNTLNLRSSHNVRDQVSQPYKTADKIMVLYTLIFTFFERRREDKRF